MNFSKVFILFSYNKIKLNRYFFIFLFVQIFLNKL